MSADRFWPKTPPSFRQIIVKRPSEHRQRIAIISVILKALKISTRYVDNSVENAKPMRSDRCPALAFVTFA